LAAGAAAFGASGLAGAAGAAGAFGAAGAAGAAEEDDDDESASSLPQATTRTISIEATSNPASIPDLRSIFILINFPPTLIHQKSSGFVYFFASINGGKKIYHRVSLNSQLIKMIITGNLF
jgi:hypothetical protein